MIFAIKHVSYLKEKKNIKLLGKSGGWTSVHLPKLHQSADSVVQYLADGFKNQAGT